jgi:hypothetical protein
VDTFLQSVQKYYNDAEKSTIQAFLQKDMKYGKQEQMSKIRKIISESVPIIHPFHRIALRFVVNDSIDYPI